MKLKWLRTTTINSAFKFLKILKSFWIEALAVKKLFLSSSTFSVKIVELFCWGTLPIEERVGTKRLLISVSDMERVC